MANRRMLSLKIADTDEFLDMPPTTQNLYFHFNLRADDDGFVDNPKKIMKITNASDDDMKVLIAKNFIIPFDSGICVIKHWKIHNLIRKDRYTETEYKKEKGLLIEKDNKYMLGNGQQNDNQMTTNGSRRLGKVSIGKDRIDKRERTPAQEMKLFLTDEEEPKRIAREISEKSNLSYEQVISELKNFAGYWTELNGNGKKQRWEMQKTFQLSRRISTWFKNVVKFNNNNNKPTGVRI